MSARPLPYSDASSRTPTFIFPSAVILDARPGPCLSSPASARWKIFQPFFERSALVADGVMIGRPASSNLPLTAFDSPENAGPTIPRTPASAIALSASAGAWSGSPCESYASMPTWQSAFASLNSATARSRPFLMLTPRLPASPVSAPKNAIFTPSQDAAAPSDAESSPPQATPTSDRPIMSALARTIRLFFICFLPLGDW